MPSLAGLFGRKKAATKQQRAETDSAVSSSPTDYVTADRYLPSSPNGTSSDRAYGGVYPSLVSNTSKLRLPFARKKQREPPAAAASTTSFASVGQASFSTPPRPSYVRTPRSSTDSDVDVRRLRPPPSKSAIFAAYADPHNALSTRSLPNEPSPLASRAPNTPVPPKKPGFFHWSKSVPKNTSPTSAASLSPPDDSFNLKSFRHVGPPSSSFLSTPTTSLSPTSSSFSAPLPRPRLTSTDSSQRISVAAFRGAQARRSTGESPVPSLRTPSPGPQPLYSPAPAQPQRPRRQSSGLAYANSDGDEDEDDSASRDDDDDDDEEEVTIKGRGAGIARALIKTRGTKSEVGHGPREYAYGRPTGTRAQSSHILTNEYQYPVNDRDRSHSSLGFNVGTVRARASVSTSAVTPSRDAKRASVLTSSPKRHTRATSDHSASSPAPSSTATLQPLPTRHPASPSPVQPRPRQPYSPSRSSNTNSSSDSDDDAPLARLVPPRRPGSALSSLSSSSNPHPRPLKPLIDINELTRRGRPPVVGPTRDDDGFTAGRTLLAVGSVGSLGSVGSASASPGGVGGDTEAKNPVKVSVSPPRRFVSPPASPKGGSVKLVESADRPLERDGIGERLNRALGVGGGTTKPVVARAMTEPLPLVGMHTSAAPVTTAPETTMSTAKVVKMRSSTSVAASTMTASTGASTSTSTSAGNAKLGMRPSAGVKPVVVVPQRLSTPVDDLATLLGAGVNLIRRTEDDDDEEEEESDDDDDEDEEEEDEEEDEESEESEERGRRKAKGDNKKNKNKKKKAKEETEKPIAPIPIKQRAPPPSFRVTSRPPFNRDREGEGVDAERNRNSAVLSVGGTTGAVHAHASTSASTSTSTKPAGILNFPSVVGKEAGRSVERDRDRPLAVRQRSSTLIPGSVSASSLSPIPSTSTSASNSNSSQGTGHGHPQGQGAGRYSLNSLSALSGHGHGHGHSHSHSMGVGSTAGSTIAMPSRPFASGRRESPAGSSTGDSSSGRAPVTPRDGSEVGVGMRHVQRRSVSFEDDMREGGGYVVKGRGARGARGVGVRVGAEGEGEEDEEGEERRKERRRSEAKAAIELGNVINGRGPIVDDDDDDDLPINQTMASAQARRMSTLNPMMGGFGPGMPGWNMNMPMPGMNMNMNMNPHMNMNMGGMGMGPGMLAAADAGYMAAHQQAMMYAKQAYQMAVAQQAMAAAGDEWERGSTFGGAASVYGGSTPSVVGTPPFMMGMGMNMMGGMNAGGMGNGWSTGSAIFPGSARSMYGGGGGGGGISGSRSEYGGGAGGGGQWSSSKSSYGDYGAASNRHSKMMGGGRRDSGYLPPVPPMPTQHGSAASSSSVKGGLAVPRARTASQPATPSKGARRAPPPSSWRAGGF